MYFKKFIAYLQNVGRDCFFSFFTFDRHEIDQPAVVSLRSWLNANTCETFSSYLTATFCNFFRSERWNQDCTLWNLKDSNLIRYWAINLFWLRTCISLLIMIKSSSIHVRNIIHSTRFFTHIDSLWITGKIGGNDPFIQPE